GWGGWGEGLDQGEELLAVERLGLAVALHHPDLGVGEPLVGREAALAGQTLPAAPDLARHPPRVQHAGITAAVRALHDGKWHHSTRVYRVKEIFGPTLQGEGAHAGRPCVFPPPAGGTGRSPWSPPSSPRGAGAPRRPEEPPPRLVELDAHATRMVVVTGGEPALQWDEPLAAALRAAGFRVHMETNGTR